MSKTRGKRPAPPAQEEDIPEDNSPEGNAPPVVNKAPQRYAHVVFTINNWSEEDLPDPEPWDYLVYGKETGEKGTPHLQGYGKLKKRLRHKQICELLPRAWVSKMRGTPQEASDYAKKDGDFVEHGTVPPKQGDAGGSANLARYEAAKASAVAGDLDAIPADLLTRHYSTYKRMKQDHQVPLPYLPTTSGVWITGETGSGKSHYAREKYPDYYLKACNKWWDGYTGQDNVIIEDMDPGHEFLGHNLKLWADRFDFVAEQKGATIRIRPKTIVVTSQYTMDQIWINKPEDLDAIKRRFRVVKIYRDLNSALGMPRVEEALESMQL